MSRCSRPLDSLHGLGRPLECQVLIVTRMFLNMVKPLSFWPPFADHLAPVQRMYGTRTGECYIQPELAKVSAITQSA